MALIFPRLARNFIKNGYFPTDSDTLGRLYNFLAPADGPLRLLDPCCGGLLVFSAISDGTQS